MGSASDKLDLSPCAVPRSSVWSSRTISHRSFWQVIPSRSLLRIDELGSLQDSHFIYPLFFQIEDSCYEDQSTCDSLTNLDRLIYFFRSRGEAMRIRVGRSSQTAVSRYERRPQGCAFW